MRKGSENVVGPMPPYGEIITAEDDIWKIIAWIRAKNCEREALRDADESACIRWQRNLRAVPALKVRFWHKVDKRLQEGGWQRDPTPGVIEAGCRERVCSLEHLQENPNHRYKQEQENGLQNSHHPRFVAAAPALSAGTGVHAN